MDVHHLELIKACDVKDKQQDAGGGGGDKLL